MKSAIRLPSHITPEHYQILIKPDLDNFTFEGEEVINLEIKKPSKEITLHSHELDIEGVEIIHTSTPLSASKISYDKKNETARFTFNKSLPKGKAQLKLKFRGILSDKMFGFYRSKYLHQGKEKHLATTQFEATYARRAFPCFDEPSLKATFEVSLVIPENLTAISNTIETEIAEHSSGYKLVKFAPTPKMSTYLLAYLVGDFESVEGKTKDGVKVRVFTTPGKKSQAKFALNVAIKCLEFYNSYFGIPYPLPIMDLIAIPDFAHGAMENWGAVTYRESALLVDENQTSTANKQWVALVIAHELAHQWFGNLVTMEWWTHIWLNEGFASFIEYLAIDHIFPDWDVWTQFVSLEQGTALQLDGLKNTHPIEVDVEDPAQISEIFDKVSYSKGASVIRMLSEYLGFEDFRKGLRIYLKKHSYSNAATEDLWKALSEASGKDVGKIMKNWTSKGGYPVVSLKNGKLTQERFFSSPLSRKSSKEKTIWNIPLNVLVNGKVEKYLIDKKSIKLTVIPNDSEGSQDFNQEISRFARNDKPIKLNVNDAAFVRVYYSPGYLKQLEQAIKEEKLSVVDRLGLIRDVFDLSEAGYLETKEALEFVQAFKGETDYSVWLEISSHLSTLSSLLANEGFYESYKSFAREIFSKIASKMGWTKKKGEKHTDSLLRSTVVHSFGKYGDLETIKKAKELFTTSNIDPDLKGLVYDLSAENGGEKGYRILLERYKKEQVQQERDRLGRALGAFGDQGLLEKTLEFALSDQVRLQDKVGIITRVWVNPKGRELAWRFVKKNWKKIQSLYSGGHHLSRLIDAAGVFTSKKEAKDVEAFFKKNPLPEAQRTILQVLEQINSNSEWLKRDSKKIKEYL